MKAYTVYYACPDEEAKTFLAPNAEEALTQCYAYLDAHKIRASIVDFLEINHEESEYQHNTFGNVMTEDELYYEYRKAYRNREIPFTVYLSANRNLDRLVQYVEVSK